MIDCLVSFGTPEYFHRQFLLGSSTVATGVVKLHMPWNPTRIIREGFGRLAPDISLRGRGAGFFGRGNRLSFAPHSKSSRKAHASSIAMLAADSLTKFSILRWIFLKNGCLTIIRASCPAFTSPGSAPSSNGLNATHSF